jgi:hypothetical protein
MIISQLLNQFFTDAKKAYLKEKEISLLLDRLFIWNLKENGNLIIKDMILSHIVYVAKTHDIFSCHAFFDKA